MKHVPNVITDSATRCLGLKSIQLENKSEINEKNGISDGPQLLGGESFKH